MRDLVVARAIHALRGRPRGLESGAPERIAPQDPDALANRAIQAIGGGGMPPLPLDQARAAYARALIEEGRGALHEVAARGDAASISRTQSAGLEAIVRLTGRPSLLVQDGTFDAGKAGDWVETMKIARRLIDQSIASVGRVNVSGAPLGYLGTAFMASDEIAVTNQHVVIEFADRTAGGWEIAPGTDVTVDFHVEHERPARQAHRVLEVIGVHFDPLIDLALIRLARKSEDGKALPPPLPLSSEAALPAEGRSVYVVGYPALGEGNDAAAIDDIFQSALRVKRIAPGEVMEVRRRGLQFTHDCSTLRGSSGSCVVDMSDHHVVGLHCSGSFQQENRAVSLAQVRGDPLVAGKGLNFR